MVLFVTIMFWIGVSCLLGFILYQVLRAVKAAVTSRNINIISLAIFFYHHHILYEEMLDFSYLCTYDRYNDSDNSDDGSSDGSSDRFSRSPRLF